MFLQLEPNSKGVEKFKTVGVSFDESEIKCFLNEFIFSIFKGL